VLHAEDRSRPPSMSLCIRWASGRQISCEVLLLICRTGIVRGMTFHGYVGLQSRGLIALPSELRRRMHLDEPGAQVEILERADGVIELRAALPVPADQAWFWTEQWQRREREVDEHVARGEVAVHESTDDFLTHLDELDSPAAKS
jgi:bifunctional DNA-binding transcriptional regulator/antitoxin component of YhaV-PrlF toxin-antitoxin module